MIEPVAVLLVFLAVGNILLSVVTRDRDALVTTSLMGWITVILLVAIFVGET